MTSFQKIIKYGAIGFAIYLCFMIISFTIFAITAVFGITTGVGFLKQNSQNTAILTKWEQEYENITSLKVNLDICKLTIKKGEKLKVEASNVTQDFHCKVEQNELKIKEPQKNRWFLSQLDKEVAEVIIYVPETLELREVEIETGMNETNIEYVKADKIDIEMGLGKYQIQELIANDAKIDAGAGETKIQNSQIESLKLEAGLGSLTLTSKILKNADIDCGMGRVEINLLGKPEDYQVKAETGLGAFLVNGKQVSDKQVIGDGNSIIKIDAGVGETVVNLQEEKEI